MEKQAEITLHDLSQKIDSLTNIVTENFLQVNETIEKLAVITNDRFDVLETRMDVIEYKVSNVDTGLKQFKQEVSGNLESVHRKIEGRRFAI